MLLNPGRPYSLGKLGKLKVNSIIKNINSQHSWTLFVYLAYWYQMLLPTEYFFWYFSVNNFYKNEMMQGGLSYMPNRIWFGKLW